MELKNDIYKNISEGLNKFYSKYFEIHGDSSQGMGWENDYAANVRHNRMIKVIDEIYDIPTPKLLDVGCGTGHLLDYCKKNKINVEYTGLDILEDYINISKNRYPNAKFILEDVIDMKYNKEYDFVICNGILTYKNTATIPDMEQYFKVAVQNMFNACRVGIAFNVVSTYVQNFDNRNFYKHPLQLLSFCLEHLGSSFKVDHSFRSKDKLHDYVLYVYRPSQEIIDQGIKYTQI